MKQVGKHAWGTPKCAISLVKNVWSKIETDKDYSFLLARNPYNRLVSVYTEKVIDVNRRYARQHGVTPTDYDVRGNFMTKVARKFTNVNKSNDPKFTVKTLSFKQFALWIDKDWLQRQDDHVAPQIRDKPNFVFDDIIFVEDLPGCFEIPRDRLDVEIDCSKNNLLLLGGTDKGDSHATPTKEDLNDVTEAWDKPAEFWWTHGAVPKDYSLMYDDELKDHVYESFREDFEYLGLSK
ncbi:hypothetical protein KNU05_gp101 [Synechococcus virus S-PRM1]|uniref:Sulfotransferase family protein n=1 Tax=Synechococcus virus S-PRM1 TaxID=2100130 RepID=A0A346FKE8_9CAUD|nr:hypothetical protein KNU05_gp101 [Synechococcus virus S-PRM1]AXN58453.1 hypothetical protein [Synechococcus virus S-PRM1]